MSLDEILVKTGRKTEGNEGTCVPDEMTSMKLSMLDGEYWDDLSGARLDKTGVKKARVEEIRKGKKHRVYTKVPVAQCWERTGKKPIGTRFVDVNKGDNVNPEYRSRWVAQELNVSKREDLFAATPPLEAEKTLMSMAVTEGIGYRRGKRKSGKKLDFIDVRRAYFHAQALREIYVDLPEEDYEEGKRGLLNKGHLGHETRVHSIMKNIS